MADTLYAFTAIDHGYTKDGSNKTAHFNVGDEFNAEGFTREEVAALIKAGALSRVNRVEAELPAVTEADLDNIVMDEAMGNVSGVQQEERAALLADDKDAMPPEPKVEDDTAKVTGQLDPKTTENTTPGTGTAGKGK